MVRLTELFHLRKKPLSFFQLLIIVSLLMILVYICGFPAVMKFEEYSPVSVWARANNAMNKRELYSEGFDVDEVLFALRNSKIIAAKALHRRTTFKLKLQLEGGQWAMFKSKFPKDKRCENPEHEIAAFTINRMLQMRNMPFVTGRVINWIEEIAPVASDELNSLVKEYRSGSEHGVKLNCRCKGSSAMSTFIYPNGDIPGAIIFWYDKPVREIFTISYSYKGDTSYILVDPNLHEASHPFAIVELEIAQQRKYPVRTNGKQKGTLKAAWSMICNYNYPAVINKGFNLGDAFSKSSSIYSSPQYKEELEEHCKTIATKEPSETWLPYLVDSSIIDFLLQKLTASGSYIKDQFGNSLVNIMIDRGNGFIGNSATYSVIAPLQQCCRIGTRTYSHLMTHRHHFIEKMNEMSKIDVLSPLLSIQEEKRMNNSLTDILYMLQTCINEKGKDTVVINY